MFSRLARTRDDALGISRRMAGECSLRRRARTGRPQPAPPRCDDLGHLATSPSSDRDHRTRRNDR